MPEQSSEDKRSILMLGGSRQQVVAIETAKRLGYRTVVCDYLPDNPGQYHADRFYLESTTDQEAMLRIAREENVDGVLAYASDPAAPTAAYVAEALSLPTNPLAAVQTLSVKHLFRRHLAQNGFPCPKSIPVPSDVDPERLLGLSSDLEFPVVVKPTDSSGSKGISILDAPDPERFRVAVEHAREFSRNGTLLMEEYITSTFPRVIGGDVFVVDGTVRFWGLMSCLRDQALGGLVPVGERYPSGLSDAQMHAVREQIQRLVDSLGIRFGEFNVEMIVGRGGVPYFLELGARAGGNMIPVQLSDISGIDLVEANVRCAMGDYSMDVSFDSADAAVATYVPHASVDGVFQGLDIDPELRPYLYRTVMYVDEGAGVERFDGANKALGILFLRFDSVAQLEDAMGRIGKLVRPRIA